MSLYVPHAIICLQMSWWYIHSVRGDIWEYRDCHQFIRKTIFPYRVSLFLKPYSRFTDRTPAILSFSPSRQWSPFHHRAFIVAGVQIGLDISTCKPLAQRGPMPPPYITQQKAQGGTRSTPNQTVNRQAKPFSHYSAKLIQGLLNWPGYACTILAWTLFEMAMYCMCIENIQASTE